MLAKALERQRHEERGVLTIINMDKFSLHITGENRNQCPKHPGDLFCFRKLKQLKYTIEPFSFFHLSNF
jgi:hypothetical protein